MKYYLYIKGKVSGPHLPGEISAGAVPPDALASTEFEWDGGRPQWRKISLLPELAGCVSAGTPPGEREPRSAAVKRSLRILSTDDDPNIRALLWNMLGEAGHNVEFARDGEEVFVRLREKDYDLLILDVNMPKVNGYKVSEILHEKLPSPPKVLIFTGRDLKDEKLQFFCSGADAILNKGTGNDKLLETIEALFSEEPPAPKADSVASAPPPVLAETLQEAAGIVTPEPGAAGAVVLAAIPEDRGFAGAPQGGEELKKELLRLRRQLGHMELGYAQLEDRLFRQGKENAAANMEYFGRQSAEIRSLRSFLSVALLLFLLGLVVAAFVQGG
ncbi:MAG: response regulator [Elusimicrobiales bacterium]